jgi:hypothetical protein
MNKKSIPADLYVSVDEAVARLINLQDLPPGFSLLEMTSAFLEEAEANLHNAKLERPPTVPIHLLERKLTICRLRHELAEKLVDGIRSELDTEVPRITLQTGSTATLRWQSVRTWARDEFDLQVAAQAETVQVDDPEENHAKYTPKLLKWVGPRGWGRPKTINMLASFYVLAFDFAKKTPKQFLSHGQLCIDPLAKELAAHTLKNHPYFESFGQSMAYWKACLQAAEAAHNSAEEFVSQKR